MTQGPAITNRSPDPMRTSPTWNDVVTFQNQFHHRDHSGNRGIEPLAVYPCDLCGESSASTAVQLSPADETFRPRPFPSPPYASTHIHTRLQRTCGTADAAQAAST